MTGGYTDLFLRLCDCAGLQPSRTNPRAEGHRDDCPYRLRVEAEATTTTINERESDEKRQPRQPGA
jgi:hypothetical protein